MSWASLTITAPAFRASSITASTSFFEVTLCPSVKSVGLGGLAGIPASCDKLFRGQRASFTPDANQGPLLGIFITGPLGFILGGIGGLVYRLVKSRKTAADG